MGQGRGREGATTDSSVGAKGPDSVDMQSWKKKIKETESEGGRGEEKKILSQGGIWV